MKFPANYYENKTILITGAAGFIGSSVVKKLCDVNCNLICLHSGKRTLTKFSSSKAHISFRKANVRTSTLWDEHLDGVDIVFHFAGQTSSQFANQAPMDDVRTNLLPIVRFLETCKKKKLRPDILFSGTVTQVGFTRNFPNNENLYDNPNTIYDINKLAGEKYLQYYSRDMGGRAATLRLSNVYGPGPKSGSADRGILNMMTQGAIKGKPLTIYGEGAFVRDYIFIDDVVNAFLVAGEKLNIINGNYYVLGSGKGHTIKQAAEIIKNQALNVTGKNVELQHIAPPESLSKIETRQFVADSSNFKKDTGWEASVSLETGIDKTIKFFSAKNDS